MSYNNQITKRSASDITSWFPRVINDPVLRIIGNEISNELMARGRKFVGDRLRGNKRQRTETKVKNKNRHEYVVSNNSGQEKSFNLVYVKGSGVNIKSLMHAKDNCSLVKDTVVVYPESTNSFGNDFKIGAVNAFTGKWSSCEIPVLSCASRWINTATETVALGLKDPMVYFAARAIPNMLQLSTADRIADGTSNDAYMNSQQPMSEYYLSYKYTLHVFNNQLYGQHLEVYVFVPKMLFVTANSVEVDLLQGFIYEDTATTTTSMLPNNIAQISSKCTNKYFRERWRLIKMKKFYLDPSGELNLDCFVKNSLIKFNKVENFAYYPGVSHTVYMRCRGSWCNSTAAVSGTTGYTTAPGALLVTQTHTSSIRAIGASMVTKSYMEQDLPSGLNTSFQAHNDQHDQRELLAVLGVSTTNI